MEEDDDEDDDDNDILYGMGIIFRGTLALLHGMCAGFGVFSFGNGRW